MLPLIIDEVNHEPFIIMGAASRPNHNNTSKPYHRHVANRRPKLPWRQTPLIESTPLSKAAGCMERAENPANVHFYSSSGGNAGLGCVFAAKGVGKPSTVVVPLTTKPHMVARIKDAGASEVIQYGASIREADTYMRDVVMVEARERGEEPVYVSPFDHPDTWAGHSTMIDEMAMQFDELDEDEPDVVVCSCGGGGLFNGIMAGVERNTWNKTEVLTVETEGADCLAVSLERGENTAMSKITSIATSLGVARVSDETFRLVVEGRRTGKVKNAVLTDAEAAMGCWRFAEDERILVEPACGVNLALCYGGRLKRALGRAVRPDDKVVIVVCGGSNVSASMIEEWKVKYGNLDVQHVKRHDSCTSIDGVVLAVSKHTWLSNGCDRPHTIKPPSRKRTHDERDVWLSN